jgi:hypothetical protein
MVPQLASEGAVEGAATAAWAAGAHHAVEGEASGLAATPAITASVRRLDVALAELAAMAATTPMATTAATPPKKGKQKVGLNNQC